MAGIQHLKEFQEPYLRGLVDESIALREEQPTFGQRFLPNLTVYSSTFAADIIKQTKNMATFIGYGAEPPVMDRDAVATQFGSMAAFGLQYIATIEELMAINQARNEGEKASLIARLEKKTVDIINGVQEFSDVLRAQALTYGRLDYTQGEVKIDFEYLIPAEHKIALTGTDKWSDPSADILGDLIDWSALYEETNNGKSADVIMMPREVYKLLKANTSIIAEARPATKDTASRLTDAEIASVLSDQSLPPIQVIKSRKTTVRNMYTGQDEAVEFYPAGRVVFLSEGLGNFYYGPNPEADNFEPGLVVRAADELRPKRSIIEGYAAGFPVIDVPSLILHADVL
ncbi:major capsid protein [Priestia megaterium]|uniref:major capsid protein n=1 Tax=Priestia megaterium TaxID=1404 RepID=UPI002E1AEC77|nr:major capsid protein [Priestia megaterium]